MADKSVLSFSKLNVNIVIVVALILLIILVQKYKPLPFQTDARTKRLVEELTTYEWNGTSIEMPGLQAPVTERFKDNMILTFKKNGKCTITIGDEILNGKWFLKRDMLHIEGDDFETKEYLWDGFEDYEHQYIYMNNVKNYGVSFYSSKPHSQEYLDEKEARKAKGEKEKQDWLGALELDLATIQPYFVDFLRVNKFENFRLLEIEENDKETFMEEFFQPIYTRGLHYTNWTYQYFGDGEIFLDAYELHVLNKEMDPEERKERAGETIKVHFDDIEEYIVPMIPLYDPTDGTTGPMNPLWEIISKSERYDYLDNSFELKILENPDYNFKAQFVEAWESDRFNGYMLIHVIYGEGKSSKDHAWFMLRRTSMGNWYYTGGSTFKPESASS